MYFLSVMTVYVIYKKNAKFFSKSRKWTKAFELEVIFEITEWHVLILEIFFPTEIWKNEELIDIL